MSSETPAAPAPLRSVHTTSFPELLDQLGISLIVTTYQAGKLVILRADQGVLNTHFRQFPMPMGLSLEGSRLAIGAKNQIWEFHNVPAAARRLEPPGRHDACFLPRSCQITGDVQIHEMGWGGDLLWFVNTRFSCLCTRDRSHSFAPRWRPSFVTALTPDDRCHLNGLGMLEGQPRFVTALGATDAPSGWRANKKNGGVLIDVASNEILLSGLSMPHSPRWFDDRLWLLESGTGTIGIVDLKANAYQPMTELPGFTRGLDFNGPYAFIGLSQVRETAVFSGLPITERPAERKCGVWVVDIRTGTVVAFMQFEDQVQEIFAVQVVPNTRFPDLICDDDKVIGDSFVLPDAALEEVPSALRTKS